MLRTVSLAILALLVVPPAYSVAGGPANSIAIGPDGIVDPTKDPYFLWATITSPEVHAEGGPEDDCGIDTARRPGPREAAFRIVDPIATWDPTEYLSLHEIFPQCVAMEARVPCAPVTPCPPPLPGRAYAAYDVGTGRFYAELGIETDPGMALPIGATIGLPQTQNAEQTIIVGGNSGASVLADCETCPTPP